jgi:hypothetical protein
MRLFLCAALSAAVLLAAAGCGSDDSPTTSATTPVVPGSTAAATTPSKTTTAEVDGDSDREAFIKKVNPVCEDYNKEIQDVQKELQSVGKTGNVDVFAPALKRATKAAERASRRYDAIDPPAGQEAQAELIGRALKAQAKGNQLLLDAAEADDPQQFGVASQALAQVTPKLQALMREYGMTVCGAAA